MTQLGRCKNNFCVLVRISESIFVGRSEPDEIKCRSASVYRAAEGGEFFVDEPVRSGKVRYIIREATTKDRVISILVFQIIPGP